HRSRRSRRDDRRARPALPGMERTRPGAGRAARVARRVRALAPRRSPRRRAQRAGRGARVTATTITYGPITRIEKLALIAGLVIALGLMIPLRHYLTDDTFIHLQYAKHLAEGRGLVFNVGERVYGCTSPLWVALIADGMALGLDGVLVARVLGVIATLASIVLFFQLLRRTVRTPELRAAGTVAWAAHAWMLRWSVSGMETPLAVALTLAGFVAYVEGVQWGSRPVRTGALWGLAALTRPEGVFLLGLW